MRSILTLIATSIFATAAVAQTPSQPPSQAPAGDPGKFEKPTLKRPHAPKKQKVKTPRPRANEAAKIGDHPER